MMKRNSEENALDAGGLELEYNLEGRKAKMAQDLEELRNFCQQIARFPNDVKNVIEMHFSRAIISQLTYKIYAESFLVSHIILEYRYLNSQYLLGENYDEIYEVWNSYRENVSIMIKTIDGLVKTNFFSENDYSDPSWHLIFKELYWKNLSIPMIKLEHELSTMNGNGLLQMLSETLLVIRELVEKLKNDYLFIKEDEFDTIYEANHLLYKRDYWPSEGRNFRQNVENNYLRNADNRIEELKRLLREEKNDFVHSQVGVIWRDFFVDKKELYQRMKNDGINEEQWKYFFQHICRFEEYEKWIEELQHPASKIEKEYPDSDWDKIFKAPIDVKKIKVVIPTLLPEDISLTNWFVVHKILEEIDWLQDTMDTHFISWVKDVYGWEQKTEHFKSVNSALKKQHSLDWNVRTMTSASVAKVYIDFANKIRNEFVKKVDGKTVIEDNKYYFKKDVLYIEHKK
jgi:hypothetical protein